MKVCCVIGKQRRKRPILEAGIIVVTAGKRDVAGAVMGPMF
jgi:hypothetical protein